jgi:Trypsin-like peptidase domain
MPRLILFLVTGMLLATAATFSHPGSAQAPAVLVKSDKLDLSGPLPPEARRRLIEALKLSRQGKPDEARARARSALDVTVTDNDHLFVLAWLLQNSSKLNSILQHEASAWFQHPRTPSRLTAAGRRAWQYQLNIEVVEQFDRLWAYSMRNAPTAQDVRTYVPRSAYRPIGMVTVGNEYTLTGFLISDCHVLTSRHGWNNKSLDSKVLFYIGTGKIDSFEKEVTAKLVVWGKPKLGFPEVVGDWAILELDDCVGRKFGYYPIHPSPEDWTEQTVTIAGYPGDRDYRQGLTLAKDCPVKQLWEVITSNCIAKPGSSGSPILHRTARGNLIAIGLVTLGPSNSKRNLFWGTSVYWIGPMLAETDPALAAKLGYANGSWAHRGPPSPPPPPPPPPVPRPQLP